MDLEARKLKNNAVDWEPDHSLANQLERAKEDLELVSYVASHDLEAPLRSILRYCGELEVTPLDPTASDKVQKINGEATRMKTLMQGLLEYVRLITYAPSYAQLDMNEIVQAALATLEEKITAAKAKITCGTLPSLQGHRGRMTRLFVNLIDNAIKFNTSAQPEIHITGSNLGKYAEFCVEDNGIGIDEEYHRYIFTLFQRLHKEDEYPGYGIGLALCNKIVESHGGKIWVESSLGGGSRFYFLLPVSKINS